MKRLCGCWLTLAFAFFAGHASASELRAAAVASTLYNSNIYNLDEGEISDTIVRLGPDVELRGEADQRLDYLLSYRGLYEFYAQEDQGDTMQHRERLRLRYDIDPRSRVTLDQGFRRVPNLLFDRQDFSDGDTGIDVRKNTYDRYDLRLGFEYSLTARWTLDTTVEHQAVDFEDNDDRSDNETLGFGASARYRLSPRHDVGFALRYADQEFQQAPDRLGADSDYISANLLWTFRITDGTQIDFEGGPTWITATQNETSRAEATQFVGGNQGDGLVRANFNACSAGAGQTQPIASSCRYNDANAPPIPAENLGPQTSYPLDFAGLDLSGDELSFFGRVALRAAVSDWEWVVAYTRRQSTTSGESLASAVDQLAVTIDYAPAGRRWQGYGELRWDRRESLIEPYAIDYTLVQGEQNAALRSEAFLNDTDSDTYRDAYAALLGARYAFTDQMSMNLEARVRRTQYSDSAPEGAESQAYILELSFRYDFAPGRF